MSYLILARKYRPQDFSEVIGQAHITTALKNAILQKRISQAYLFAGPRGVGKTSLARILAKSLNCIEGPTINPCQKCPACTEISQGRNLDCIEIDGASNRGIDEIRALRENVKFAPSSGRFKIYIIDEVHMLTTEAFNALLKTLEEPPEHVKFIFATTQPQKVISTVVSRCQRFNFHNIPILKIIEKLKAIAKLENINITSSALFTIAKEASGSIRDAESIFDQVITLSKEKIDVADVNSLLGTLEYDFLFDLTDKILKKDSQGTLELIRNFLNQGKDPAIIFLTLLEHLRNLTLSKFFKNTEESYLDLPLEIKERLIQQIREITLKNLLDIFDTVLMYQERAKHSEFTQIILEMMVIKLTLRNDSNNPLPKIENNSSKLTNPTPKLEIQNNPQPEAETEKELPIKLETLKEKWNTILEDIAKVKMSISMYLREAHLLDIDKGVLRLGFPKHLNFHKEVLEYKENYLILEKILNKFFNLKLKIKIEIIPSADKQVDTGISANKEIDAPIIRSALERFGGRLVD